MHNDLRETWVYQEIFREGYEEGYEIGLKMAREERRQSNLEWWRKALGAFIGVHYPEIANLARSKSDAISDPDVLYDILMKVILANTEEEIAAALA